MEESGTKRVGGPGQGEIPRGERPTGLGGKKTGEVLKKPPKKAVKVGGKETAGEYFKGLPSEENAAVLESIAYGGGCTQRDKLEDELWALLNKDRQKRKGGGDENKTSHKSGGLNDNKCTGVKEKNAPSSKDSATS